MSRGAFKLRDADDDAYDQGYYQGYYQGYKVATINNLPVGIAYGAYIVVYIASVYVILSKPSFTSSRFRKSLFGMTTLMFAWGIATLVITTISGIQDANPNSLPACTTCSFLFQAAPYVMCVICDLICAWRTVIIWNNDKRVIIIILSSILFSTGIGMWSSIMQGTLLLSGRFYLVLLTGPILVTNLLSTGLITWKAWQRRIPVMVHLREGSRSLRLERVFALLIESGFIYCCIWILFTIFMIVDNFPGPGFTVIGFVSGIYPTLIIILISKQMSPVEHYSTHSTHSTEMQYTGVPRPGPRRDGNTP